MRYAVSALLLVAAFARAADRPNVLIAIADDMSWPHAGCYGDPVVKTPHFDRVAREGMLFSHAFCVSPSCTPSRAALLTGQTIHRLDEGGNLWSFLPKRFAVYPDLLEQAGYAVGLTGKGWGPGDFTAGGRTRNPAGPTFPSFEKFLATVPADKPFCYFFGSTRPHRPYELGCGLKVGLSPDKVSVPPFWPDTPAVRSDILDYYANVQMFDNQLGTILDLLDKSGQAANTLLIVTSDNGWPFPRAKANLYDAGTRMPLAIRWPGRVKPGSKSDRFINHADHAPTILEAVGLKPLPEMTGKSYLAQLNGREFTEAHRVYVERERHANVRKGDLSYPARAVRTRQFLYIRNLRPERWPGGDPEKHVAVGPFGDCDAGPTKEAVLADRTSRFFDLCFAKRPAEELYDVSVDPHQIVNLVGRPEYAKPLAGLRADLDRWQRDTGDPADDRWDKFPYFGDRPNPGKSKSKSK
ncbi:MAG: sulfatase [Gemmataceae bacterium]